MTRIRSALPLLALPLLAGPAGASALRWEPAANGAAIVLPVPVKARGITGGTLSCAEQRWVLRLRAERALQGGEARIAFGEASLTALATLTAGTVEIALPAEAVGLLKDGTDMAVTIGGGDDAASARFPLAGSRTAIAAVAPLCSPPQLPGLDAVQLAPAGAAADAAGAATAEEAGLFREATGRAPALSAAFVPGEGGKTLLFASLCGSSRYYGETGCKLMGFAADGSGAWKTVYESEGMHLFRDPRTAHGGWPDLVTLLPAGAEALRWAWDGAAYQVQDGAAVAGAMPGVIDELRTGGTGE